MRTLRLKRVELLAQVLTAWKQQCHTQISQEFISSATYTTARVLSDKTPRWEMAGKEVHPRGEVTHLGAGEAGDRNEVRRSGW